MKFLVVLLDAFWRIRGLFLSFLFFILLCLLASEEMGSFSLKESLTYLLLQQQQYPVSFVLFGNNYMLVANNKLEGRIADLFVTVIVDSEAEGRGYY